MSANIPSLEVVLGGWTGGMNSFTSPDAISESEYAWAENLINRGGIVQTRCGRKIWTSLTGNKPQGGCIFTPRDGQPVMMLVIDGILYIAYFPSFDFVELGPYTMNPDAPIVRFQECIKSTNLSDEGELEIITPMKCVIIQDGFSKPLFWDGNAVRQLDPGDRQTPTGLWMAWTGSRLWVFQGSRGYASDLGDPTSFTETTYVAERSSFEIGDDCTGCIIAADKKGLLAFTRKTCTAFQAFILKRSDWLITPDFQVQILSKIGCVAGQTLVNQYGCTQWMSEHGWMSLDAAFFSLRSSKLRALDEKMMRSKRSVFSDTSGACATSYENFLLVAVPHASKYNTHTWCMDQAPVTTMTEDGVWSSAWSGTRPVCFFTGDIGGRERCFQLAIDETEIDGKKIHLWEEFRVDNTDSDGRIWCQFETRMVTSKNPMRFMYAEIEAVEIAGTVEVTVYVGGSQGPWFLIGSTTVQAEIGCFGAKGFEVLTDTTELISFKKQARTITTTNFSPQDKACSPENEQPGFDKGFQLLIEWKGQMGIRQIKMVLDPNPSHKQTGECMQSEECENNAIDEEGNKVPI